MSTIDFTPTAYTVKSPGNGKELRYEGENWKNAIVDAAETDTVFLNRFSRPALRALRTKRTTRLEREESVSMAEFGRVTDLYFGGDLEASIALGGQVMGRIDAVEPVQDIITRTMREFDATVQRLADRT